MKYIVWDVIKANELAVLDTVKNKNIIFKRRSDELMQKVFYLHQINKNDFYNSYKFYLENPHENQVLMDSVYQVGQRDKTSLYIHKNII